MKSLKKPYKNSPYFEIKSMKCTWAEEMETDVKEYIATLEQQLHDEAEYCGVLEMLDDTYLYKCFLNNKDNQMYFGNWEVLKYFLRKMRIKLAKEIIGEFCFTKQDKEMYDYFCSVQINEKNKCKPAILKFKSCAEIQISNLLYSEKAYRKYKVYYKFDSFLASDDNYDNNVAEIPYFSWFEEKFNLLDDVVRHVKMLNFMYGCDLFTSKFKTRYLNGYLPNDTVAFESLDKPVFELNSLKWKITKSKTKLKSNHEMCLAKFLNKTKTDDVTDPKQLIKNDFEKFVKANSEYKQIIMKLYEEFISSNKDRLKDCPSIFKENLLFNYF